MVTNEQSIEFIKLMRQAIMSADSATEDYAEPVARMLNRIIGEVVDDDLHLDCGKADDTTETEQNS